MKEKPGFFAVIPSAVRYCPAVPPNAKLLYAEISALCNATGYCWASDKFFADNFEVTTKTVKNLLAALEENNFVIVQEEKTVDGDKLRKIYINPAGLIMTAGKNAKSVEKIFHDTENNFPILENFFRGIYRNNNINNNPPIVPQGDEPKKQKRQRPEPFEPERFSLFWDYYKSLVPKGVRIGGKASAQTAWDNLRPDGETKKAMFAALRQESASESWKDGSGIKYVSTWLNAFSRGDVCETGSGGNSAPIQTANTPAGGWD